MRKIVAAPQSNEYKKAYYEKCGKPSALELEKKEIDVAAPEVGGVEADGSERGSGSTDAKKRKHGDGRLWYLRNIEHRKACNRQHRAHIQERQREYKLRNRETINAQNRQYRLRKREQRRMEKFQKRME